MTKTILIGKNRRVTIDELLSLSQFPNEIQLHDAAPEGGTNDDPSPSSLALPSTTDVSTLSQPVSISILAHLSLTASQKDNTTPLATSLITLLRSTSPTQPVLLPSDVLLWPTEISSLPSVRRSTFLAMGAYAAGVSRQLVKIADAIGALSAQRLLGNVEASRCYDDGNYDVARPHRGMVISASVLRAVLEGGRYKGSADDESTSPTSLHYARTIPQYHGAARDAIEKSCKTLELELNCHPTDRVELDMTIASMALSECLNAVMALLNGSKRRLNMAIDSDDLQQPTEILKDWTDDVRVSVMLDQKVTELKESLEKEAEVNISFLESEIKTLEKEAAEKEAAKTAAREKNPNDGGSSKPTTDKNEFEGLTEAQIAKILKKRAEKEKKAMAKKKAKKSPAAGLFGQGILPILSALSPSPPLLTPDTISTLTELISSLLLGGQQRKPKIPKGTRDYLPSQMAIRSQAFSIIRRVFCSHGAVEIDTPVFELKDTLTGKYGEDSKLIYDLADQGGELLALRYDLTVPFARFLALNRVGNIKRFHIGKVYRRDQPALARGRYREFYQCDFDIAGVYGRMVPDAECLCVVVDILKSLDIGDFAVKLNHRRLLDAILDLCGVPKDKFRTICSAVDKLDKEPWEEVKREMVQDKGLDESVADKIGTFVLQKGRPKEMYETLTTKKQFGKHKGASEALEDLRILFDYLDAFGKLDYISFDLSLARGLDYYTGVIYEAVCLEGNTQVGSIGGGGRYDNLVGMFQDSGKQTPCVGVSVGIERVFTLMEARLREKQGGHIDQPSINVIVVSRGKDMLQQRMQVTKRLWDANISAEFSQKENNNLKYEIANALEKAVPFMVILKEETWDEGKIDVKDLAKETQEEVTLEKLVKTLMNKGVIPVGCEFAMQVMKQKEEDKDSD